MADLQIGKWLAVVDGDASAPRKVKVDATARRMTIHPRMRVSELLSAIASAEGETPHDPWGRVPILGVVS